MSGLRLSTFLWSLLVLLAGGLLLRADPPVPPSADQMAQIASSLKWQTGTVTLRDGLAKIDLGPGFRYLDPADADKVLHELWGNPPQSGTLGMIFPAEAGPLDRGGWGVIVTYEGGGYVKDNDASTINYTELLKQMQAEIQKENPERVKAGYPAMELVGWATPPRYDPATHKLYWAKEIHFGDDTGNTLNYCVRVLGRRGVLELNAVAAMVQFPIIEQAMPRLISQVDFQPGNLYSDFDPRIDKVAKYGLAALVAGGVLGAAAKLGLLKFLWPVILVFKKAFIFIVVAAIAGFKKLGALFRKKPPITFPSSPPGPPPPSP
jgi:uncharacterized membrane-anchored protein